MHSEDPGHPETPDFMASASFDTYVAFRNVLVLFTNKMHEEGVRWDFQPDWNFTQAVTHYEIDNSTMIGIPELLAETSGKNIYRYMAEDKGVQIDPHSHESRAFGQPVDFNYADVAYLISLTGVTPSGIVGGHVIEGDNYQNWPRFKMALSGSVYPNEEWTAEALMGGGTGSHQNEENGSGIWYPMDPGSPAVYDNYWLNDPTSNLLAIGNWSAEGSSLDGLISQIEGGQLSSAEVFTATVSVNHSDLVIGAYGALTENEDRVTTTAMVNPSAVDQIFDDLVAPVVAVQANGKAALLTFNETLTLWETEFGSRPNLCKNTTTAPETCTPVPF
jgi:hypothetical protein